MNISRLSKYFYIKFIRLKGDPQSLAMGTAIGVLIGLTPTMPLHTIAILLLTFATRSSAIAGILSSWIVCNPLTCLPIYYLSIVIGNAATPYQIDWQRVQYLLDNLTSHKHFMESLREMAGLGYETIMVMITGGLVLALPFTVASYYFSLVLFRKVRKDQQKRAKSVEMSFPR